MSEENKNLDAKVNALEKKFDALYQIMQNGFTTANNNFQVLSDKISALHNDTNKGFDEVKYELVKIQTATSYEEIFQNSQKFNRN